MFNIVLKLYCFKRAIVSYFYERYNTLSISKCGFHGYEDAC